MECFTIRGLTFSYPEQSKKTLDDLTFCVQPGEFIALAGPSGCGKTTLLRQLKSTLAPHGHLNGEILFEGRLLNAIDQREQSSRIGFVMQNPDNQIVTDKVWHELAFGLESLGYSTSAIRGRVAEMASFFGIQTWFYKNVTELSGGQKQLLNLASIMAMGPSVLILDEPTSQLDPIAAADFLAAVGKINRELGTTVIMTEHRLDEVFPMSDRVLVMDNGKIICDGSPQAVGELLKSSRHSMFLSMPAPMRIYAAVPNALACPITVRDGRMWLDRYAGYHPLTKQEDDTGTLEKSDGKPVVELDEVWFKYEKDGPDVVRGLSLKAYEGEFLAILGGNGVGKTTAMSLIAGINKPYRGKVLLEDTPIARLDGKLFDGLLGVLPQNPQALFVKKTVREDLLEILKNSRLSKEERTKKLAQAVHLCRLDELTERHPYDLSGGEQQRAALAKVLLLEPRILLLDEPTKGLDAEFKQVFAEILGRLLHRGVTIIMVSHDIEFCAKYAHRCAMFFDGSIVTEDEPRTFFSGNSFYTTASNRMARHLLPEAVTAEDVISACGGEPAAPPQLPGDDIDDDFLISGRSDKPGKPMQKLPFWRKMAARISGAAALAAAFFALSEVNIPFLTSPGNKGLYITLIVSLIILVAAISRKGDRTIENAQVQKDQRKLPKRTIVAAAMILLAIPLTIFLGFYYLDNRKYYFISLLIILETMAPFALIFEGRKPQARELVIIAVLSAIAVAGRAAFFMLPQFKPVMAVVIIAGVAFGGETGFLIGAVSMLVSNMIFSQGPWTPWQMFSMGIIGFLAGVLFRKGLLLRSRLPLSIFGALAAIIIYGGLMNPSYVLMYQDNPTWPMFLSAYTQGFPFDLVHAAATAFFLWVMSRPMLEKLDRIKVKYGLVEHKNSEQDLPAQENDDTPSWLESPAAGVKQVSSVTNDGS